MEKSLNHLFEHVHSDEFKFRAFYEPLIISGNYSHIKFKLRSRKDIDLFLSKVKNNSSINNSKIIFVYKHTLVNLILVHHMGIFLGDRTFHRFYLLFHMKKAS